ncbi:MAG: peptidase M14, partial [Candidatus Methanomethylicia archaeon]
MPLYNMVKNVVEKVPEFKDFMKVKELYKSSEELAKKYCGYIENVDVGPSRTELPVKALIIHGSEDKRVLAFSFPHPNEPIGSLTLEFLSKYLAENNDLRRKATWIFIKVADVFGAILNEGWFKGPFDIKKYVLNYYRTPAGKQVEWSFPMEYKDLKWDKPLPETRAIMKLIDEWKPTHIYSLHNAGFTGTYYYLTKKPSEEVLDILKGIPREFEVPIHKGEAETPYMEKIDTGIFRMPSTKDEYDWLEKYLGRSPMKDIKHGGSSYDYALRSNQNVFELICEVPYLYDYRLDNDLEIGVPRREILKIVHEREKEIIKTLDEIIKEFKNE